MVDGFAALGTSSSISPQHRLGNRGKSKARALAPGLQPGAATQRLGRPSACGISRKLGRDRGAEVSYQVLISRGDVFLSTPASGALSPVARRMGNFAPT